MPKHSFLSLVTLAGLLWVTAFAAVGITRPIDSNGVEFSDSAPRIELRTALSPYHAASSLEPDGSRWDIMTVNNQLPRPITRILVAEEAPDAVLRVFPRRARPAIRQIASSDPDVIAESAQAYGRHAFRVTIPAARSFSIALRISDADVPPMVAAWNEGALAAHNRQLAVFFAAVAGLIAAALAITTGLAVMTGHAAPRWGAFTLFAVFLSRLSTSGLFDSIGATNIGGPYGLSAMLAGLSLAAGLCLVDTLAPIGNVWPNGLRRQKWVLAAIVAMSLFAFVGVPAAMVATEIAVVVGSAVSVVYLVRCGRAGNQAARVAAPSAAVFALVAAAGAVVALGGFADSPAAPGVIGGFASAGAVLLALAIAAGEGIAILPARRLASAPVQRAASPASASREARSDVASLAIGASHQGVFDFDIENGRVGLSPEAASLLGLKPGKTYFSSDDWIARIHPDDRDVYSSAMDDYRAHPGLAFRIEFRVASSTGRYPWLELRATMMGGASRASRCLGLVADVTMRKESESKAAPRDGPSALPNRAAWIAELEKMGDQVHACSIVLLDIDRFKSIHTSLGDDGGDTILAGIAQRLSGAFDPGQIYRVGGDSFAFTIDDGDARVEAIASTLAEVWKQPYRVGDREIYVSASAGIARGRDVRTADELVANAAAALAEAKRQGGGCSRLYVRDLAQPAAVDSVALESDIRRALANDELEVVYQPIMRLGDGAVAGFEALLRWRHPEKGLLEPSGFIEHSEQTGSIVALGKYALQQAAAELERWQRFFPLTPHLTVSVNLSRRQLQDTEFEELLVNVLSKADVAPGTLKLELTESAVSEIADAAPRLERLKSAGAGLAIDDFGTGLSALSQLGNLPFEALKIDKSFLAQREDTGGEAASSILRSIVGLAHELELVVVSEGVETARDAQWLREIGCDYAQGYYFSPPLPRADVLSFIARHHGGAGSPQGGETPSGVSAVGGEAGDVDPQLS